MGFLFKKTKDGIGDLIKDGLGIAKEAVTDKDKAIELQVKLELARAQLMLSGPGTSITKITICALVALVVGTGTWVFLTGGNIEGFKNYALAVTPLIGLLIGVYGTKGGKVFTNGGSGGR